MIKYRVELYSNIKIESFVVVRETEKTVWYNTGSSLHDPSRELKESHYHIWMDNFHKAKKLATERQKQKVHNAHNALSSAKMALQKILDNTGKL